MNPSTMIESVRIRGFRSLADVELSDLPGATVLIGPNGSGKSNFIHFFEMLSWMLRSRRLAEFIARQGGADDQLFGGKPLDPPHECRNQDTHGSRHGTNIVLRYPLPNEAI